MQKRRKTGQRSRPSRRTTSRNYSSPRFLTLSILLITKSERNLAFGIREQADLVELCTLHYAAGRRELRACLKGDCACRSILVGGRPWAYWRDKSGLRMTCNCKNSFSAQKVKHLADTFLQRLSAKAKEINESQLDRTEGVGCSHSCKTWRSSKTL